MAEEGLKRKLCAILSADVQGYSRLMNEDEGGGICISGTVYDSIKNKLSLGYESLGEHTVLNQDIRETWHRSTMQGMKRRGQL